MSISSEQVVRNIAPSFSSEQIVKNFAPSWFAAVMGTGVLALGAGAQKRVEERFQLSPSRTVYSPPLMWT